MSLFAEFELNSSKQLDTNITSNEIFYTQVSKVFTIPLYRLIKTKEFTNMKGKNLSPEMIQSIESFLPFYFNLKFPMSDITNEKYPSGEINRFHIVLTKYMDFLESNHRYEEFYKILEKRLAYAHSIMQNASNILSLIYASSYYANTLKWGGCNPKKDKFHQRKCNTIKMKELLLKYYVSKSEYFFVVLERDSYAMIEEVIEPENENLLHYNSQLREAMIKNHKIYIEKLKQASIEDSTEAWEIYKSYIDKESEYTFIEVIKSTLGLAYVDIQKFFSLKEIDYGYLVESQAKMYNSLIFIGMDDTYRRYRKFVTRYQTLIKNCSVE